MMFAQATDYTVHAEDSTEIGTGTLTMSYYLVDESANYLTDENGNRLTFTSIDTVYGDVLHAQGTDYTVHAEE